MRWGKTKWVSTKGEVVELPLSFQAKHVIELWGNETQAKRILLQAARWKKSMAKEGLKLTAVLLSDSDAWTLSLRYDDLDSDFKLLLGREDVSARLTRFKTLFQTQLKFSERRIERVDARYPDGLAVAKAKKKLNAGETTGRTVSNIVASNRTTNSTAY